MATFYDIEAAKKLQKHYKIKDVAEMYSISEKSIYRWCLEGKLKAHKIGGSIRIPRTELLKIIEPFN